MTFKTNAPVHRSLYRMSPFRIRGACRVSSQGIRAATVTLRATREATWVCSSERKLEVMGDEEEGALVVAAERCTCALEKATEQMQRRRASDLQHRSTKPLDICEGRSCMWDGRSMRMHERHLRVRYPKLYFCSGHQQQHNEMQEFKNGKSLSFYHFTFFFARRERVEE